MSAVYRQGEDGVSVGSLRTPTPSKSLTREYKTMSYVKLLRCAYHFIVIPCYIKLFRANNPLIITLTALDKRSFTVQANLFKNKIKNKQPPSSMHSPTRFCLIFLLSFTVTFLESSTLLVPTCLNFLDQEFVLKGEERWHWREKSTVGCQIFILPNMDKVPSNSSLPHFSNKAHCQHLKGQAPPTFKFTCLMT